MSDLAAHVVIAGAGHAGGSVAALLRQYGWKGPITLIGAEPVPPYQRPPLSKAWLREPGNLSNILLRPAEFYSKNSVGLHLSAEVTSIDRRSRSVTLADGSLVGYDELVLALGARPRQLSVPGRDLHGVVHLRTMADADALKAMLRPGARIAIVGAGYIGMEVAASARQLGANVTIVEREARVLSRVASDCLANYLRQQHTAAGAEVFLNAAVAAFEGEHGRVTIIRLSDGRTIECDSVLIAVGVVPNIEMPQAAGLACADGIIVDGAARTSDRAIHAVGDCTNRALPPYQRRGRLESVPNALEQAKQAAADLCGRSAPMPEVPWFWSDQYDIRLQIAGLPFDVAETVVRGHPSAGTFSLFHLAADCTVQAVEAVNAPADFMAGRIMIAKRTRALAASLRDVSCSLHSLAS